LPASHRPPALAIHDLLLPRRTVCLLGLLGLLGLRAVRRLLLKSLLELQLRFVYPRRLVLHVARGEALGWRPHEVEHSLLPDATFSHPAKQSIAQ
jgi:hypothetical protein